MAAAILRALGDGRTPLNAMIIAALLNIALDCLFVFVLDWGIVGAAAASVLAQLVSFLYCSASILKIDMVKLDREAWKPDPDKIKSMLLFGLPIALQYVVITLGGMILQSSVNLQGSIFIAGYTATNKLYSFLQCFAMSFGVAACTFIAQNYGAGRFDRVKQGVVDSVKIVTITAVIMTTISLVTRWQILRVFLDVEEAGGTEALAVAVRYLTIMSLFSPFSISFMYFAMCCRHWAWPFGSWHPVLLSLWHVCSCPRWRSTTWERMRCLLRSLHRGWVPCSACSCRIFITKRSC